MQLPHEFTGPKVNGEHICKWCSGTPRECSFVFGPYCNKRPSLEVQTEHGPHCDEYGKACRQCLDDFAVWKGWKVQTDGLVCEMCDEPSSCPAENCAFRSNPTLAALQRSNDAKDEALRTARPYVWAASLNLDEPDAKAILDEIDKALSHSSEASND